MGSYCHLRVGSTRRRVVNFSSAAHMSLLLVTFFAVSVMAVSATVSYGPYSSVVSLANADPEALVPLLSTGDDSKATTDSKLFDIAAGSGRGTSASRRSLAQAESFNNDAQADGPFGYSSSCPVSLEECVLPTTDYFEPLASWKLRSGHSFAPLMSLTSTSTVSDDATNCCICDIAKVCFSYKGEYVGEAIGDNFPDYEYVLSGWCFALQDHYHELFTEVDHDALVTCRWSPADKSDNSTVAVEDSDSKVAESSEVTTTPADQSLVITVARSPDQQYRAGNSDEEDIDDFENFISKLASEEVVDHAATSSEGTVIVDKQSSEVSSEDEIDSNEDAVQSDSGENSVGNTDSDSDLDEAVDDGESDSNGSDDTTHDDDVSNSGTVVDNGKGTDNDHGKGKGTDSDHGKGTDKVMNSDSDSDSDSDSGEAPATTPTLSPSPAPTSQGADAAVQVTAVQGVAIFRDLSQVEDFTTDERNNFVSTLANNLNVDDNFVRILLVSPGSVVVCWAVALPEDTTLTTEALPELLSSNLDASIVS